MNSQFQEQLKKLTFKTFHCNRMATFDYSDLFSGQRVVVFSVTQQRTSDSEAYIADFIHARTEFFKNGIDNMYVVDSTDMLVGPWADKRNLIGLPDRDMEFVRILAEESGYQKDLQDMARHWQYVTIINDGNLEKIWYNPFKADTFLYVLKSQKFRYKKMSAGMVGEYLVDNAG